MSRRGTSRARAQALAVLGVLAVGWCVLPPSPAAAHGDLVDGSPGPGSDVASGVALMQLQFEQASDTGDSTISVEGPSGSPVDVGEATVVQGRFVCARSAPLEAGVHTLDYTVPGPDAHLESGSYQFAVSQGAAAAPDGPCTGVALAAPDAPSPQQDRDEVSSVALGVMGGGVLVTGLIAAFAVARSRMRSEGAG